MEPVIKKIEIVISCRELVCAQIAKLKDDIARTEKSITSYKTALQNAEKQDEDEAKKPDRKPCSRCGGTGVSIQQGLLFSHKTRCWRCDGKGTVWRPKPLSATPYWLCALNGKEIQLAEMKRDLKYLEDQIKNG